MMTDPKPDVSFQIGVQTGNIHKNILELETSLKENWSSIKNNESFLSEIKQNINTLTAKLDSLIKKEIPFKITREEKTNRRCFVIYDYSLVYQNIKIRISYVTNQGAIVSFDGDISDIVDAPYIYTTQIIHSIARKLHCLRKYPKIDTIDIDIDKIKKEVL